MIKEKLQTEQDFNKIFVLATQNDKVIGFIDILNEMLVDNPRNYLAWLYLARSYEDIGEIEKAKNSYKKVYKSNPSDELLNEINDFCRLNALENFINYQNLESKKIEIDKIEEDKAIYSKSQSLNGLLTNTSEKKIKENGKKKSEDKNFETENSHYTKDLSQPDEIVNINEINNKAYDSKIYRASKLLTAGNLEDAIKIFTQIYEDKYYEPSFVNQYVVALQRNKEYEKAVKVLNQQLNIVKEFPKRSKLLQTKSQLLSACEKYEDAAKAYQELIFVDKKLNNNGKNNRKISNALSQLARIQTYQLGKIDEGFNSAKEALLLNPNDTPTQKLVEILEDYKITYKAGEEFKIDVKDDAIYISPMLRIDLDEYEYRDEEILEKGKPDSQIAKRILEQAKKTKEGDNIVEYIARYPLYLESAKAFSNSPIGSYNDIDFKEALTGYAVLKGNSLFNEYKLLIEEQNISIAMLARLKDSACSYYIESLDLQYTVNEKFILTSLANFLKLQVSFLLLKKNQEVQSQIFKGTFNDIFKYCLSHKDKDIEKLAYHSIISCGTASIQTWNRVALIPGGTGYLYSKMVRFNDRKIVYEFLNDLESNQISHNLRPGDFFRAVFNNRKLKNKELEKIVKSLEAIDFSARRIPEIKQKWEQIKTYQNLLTDTDLEIVKGIDRIVTIYEPYQSRGTEERTRILRDIRVTLEEQYKFILENTTYWGRVIFYPLVFKWQSELKKVEDERFELTIPQIKAIIDPNFIQQDDNSNYINLLLRNEGVATASSVELSYSINSLNTENKVQNIFRFQNEIAVNEGKSIRIEVPYEENAIEFKLSIIPFYQEDPLQAKEFSFTIEKEISESVLTLEDIPWNETRIPLEHLFRGREELIDELIKHYKSPERDKNYILYGLTRTGKSSILKYLGEKINTESLKIQGNNYQFISFSWDLGKASNQTNAKDLWLYLLVERVVNELKEQIKLGNFSENILPNLREDNVRFKDWIVILNHLKDNGYYPIFLIDEFSFYKNLADKKVIDSSFLAAIRQYTFEGLASFVFAGTYDVKELISNADYGITGQLVNIKEKIVSQIDEESAIELIEVIKDKLIFTEDAIKHILYLSNRVPYFIQILCKYCGYYAVEQKKRYIGFPEVEFVAKVLTGEEMKPKKSSLDMLSAGVFMNNQDSPTDPKHIKVLLSTIAHFNKSKSVPRGVSHIEMQELWAKGGIENFRPLLADAVDYLIAKEILIEKEEEGKTVYYIGVDLFRRFWGNQHTNMELQFDTLKERN